MDKYLITPTDSEWRISPDDLAVQLRDTWPRADVSVHDDGEAYFVLAVLGERLDGHLAADGQSLWVELGTLDQAAEVAAWFRGLVPAQAEVIFMDEGYEASVGVAPGEEAASIGRAYRLAAAEWRSTDLGRRPRRRVGGLKERQP